MSTLNPVQTNQREQFLDVLRGFSIFGIFIANLNGFSWYSDQAPVTGPYLLPEWDKKMGFLHHMLIEGKFYSIFSLLFGWGIALQIKRAITAGINPMPTVRRRLFFMLLLGGIHLFLWPGDIVFFYAVLAFILLPLRKLSNKTLVITGSILILSPILLYWLKMTWPVLNYPAELMSQTAIRVDTFGIKSDEDFMNVLKEGSWLDQLRVNVSGVFFRFNYLFFVSRVPKVLGMFLIGYALGRSDFYKNFLVHKKTIVIIVITGLLIGLPANFYLARYMSNSMGDYWTLKTNGLYQTIFYALGVAPLALAYVGIFMLAFQTRTGKKILSVLAPVGKMAFSNYILQTLIGSFVFLGPGLGYIGQVGPVYYTLFGLLVFAGQILLSTLWLNYFNYGPIEWIWRSATYKKWQPFRKRSGVERVG